MFSSNKLERCFRPCEPISLPVKSSFVTVILFFQIIVFRLNFDKKISTNFTFNAYVKARVPVELRP